MQLPHLHLRRPLHTPDRLLNAYLACRTAGPATSGLVVTSLRAAKRWCQRTRQRHRRADPS